MKKIFRYAAMICAAALAVACAEEPQDEPIVEHPTTKDLTITTEATTPDSRVLFADGEGFAWENADLTKMAVCYNEELLWKHTCSTSGAINEGIASFTATVNAESVFAYCYYPYAENNSTDSTFAYNFAANVAQSEAGKTTALRLASDVISIEGEANNVTAQFRIVGSLLRYFIYAEESDERVESVALKATSPIAGSYTYNLASAEGTVGGNTSNEVTVTLGTALSLDGITTADKAKSVFMPIVPTTSQGVTYVVTTDKNVYEFVSDAAHTWAEGAVTEIKLNLAKATNVTPIGGGEPEEPKLQLYYLFREKTGGYCAEAVSVESAGQTLMNNAWFLVGVGGNSDDKIILNNYENEPPYRDLRFECPEWMEYTHDGGQKISLKVLENTTTEERVGTFKIYSNVDTEVYEVVYADGETITIEDPVFEVTVTQAGAAEVNPDPDPEPDPSGATNIIYCFTNMAVRTSYEIGATASALQTDYFIVDENELGNHNNYDYSKPYYTDIRFEILDGEGNVANWVVPSITNNNKFTFTYEANEGAARTAVVNIYWDDTEEYKVVGTVKNDAKELEAITTTDPIMTIKLNQAAGAATPDPEPDPSGATEIIYKFTFQGMPAINFDIAANGVTDQDLQWFSAIIGGTDTADPSKAPITGWRYVATDNEGNEVDWLSIRHQNNNRIYLTCQANKAEARVATINLYWDDTAEYKVVGTYKQAAPNHQVLEEITTNDPILTLTVNQAAGNGGPTELIYEFTNKGATTLNYNFGVNGGEQGCGYFIVMINNVENVDYSADYYNVFRFEAVDADGNVVEWASGRRNPTHNSFLFACTANESGEARTATINVYWEDTDEYKVVGTYKNAERTLEAITTEDPIFSVTVNQAAQ